MRWLIVLLSTVLLLGCDQQRMLEKFSTPQDQAVAKAYIADLQGRKFDRIEANLDPSIKAPGTHDALVRMAGLLPAGPPTSVKLVGAHKLVSPTFTQMNTTLEYQWGDRWLLCNVAIQTSATAQSIVGINVYPQPSSLEEQTRFKLSGRGPAQYLILASALLAVGITLLALAACLRTKGLPRKWLWVLAIVIGVGQLSTNWVTGALSFQPLSVSLFSAAAFAPLYGPLTISVSAPVGAIVFLLLRGRLKQTPVPSSEMG